MSYQVLARKYRPQTFEEIVGQAHVATTLTNALKNQKVAHAYLFSGPRGVGKTTAARILAKTEHQKIPATILSRCQLFRFKRVSVEDITAHLEKLLKSEKVKAEPEALARLARAAGGSVRDALSLLDQSLAYASGSLTAK